MSKSGRFVEVIDIDEKNKILVDVVANTTISCDFIYQYYDEENDNGKFYEEHVPDYTSYLDSFKIYNSR